MRAAVCVVCVLLTVAAATTTTATRVVHRTPFGVQHEAPREWPSGSVVDVSAGQVLLEGGGVEQLSREAPNNMRNNNKTNIDKAGGWIVDAVFTAGHRALWFGGSWTVPPLPAANDGQTNYLFTGLQPTYASPLVIAQPVLAYQQNQGEGYTLASWFCCTAGHSTPIPANPGDKVIGTITYTNDIWKITTLNVNSGKSTVLNVKTTEALNQYYVTLEAYGIQQCSDYPTGVTTFRNLTARDVNGKVNFQWSTQVQDSTCPDVTQIVSPTEVKINYGSSK